MKRAIGIVRISQVAGRVGERFASPGEQRQRIEEACERDGLELIDVIEEFDMSGGTPLARRPGLSRAVRTIEEGAAHVLVAAYFDRLMRSLQVQGEVVSRVEAAGGAVLAVDIGAVSGASASQWLSGTMLGAVAEYHRRSIRERSAGAQARAVELGIPPFPAPLGYVRGERGCLTPSSAPGNSAVAVRQAFQLRVEGATIGRVRAFLREQGVERSHTGTRDLLANRVYLGEVRFGELVNTEAHDPIVDRALFERVQQMRVPRGRHPPSGLLLARLGVLRCGSCDGLMTAGRTARRWRYYRCQPTRDCPRHLAVSARIAEKVVVETVRHELTEIEGQASLERDARDAADRVERAQVNLNRAIRVLDDLGDEPAARDKLIDLRNVRDDAIAEAHRLSRLSARLTLNVGTDWDRLSRDAQRALIRAVVARAVVGPGAGPSRITVELFRE